MDPLAARAINFYQLAQLALQTDNLSDAVTCLGEALKCDPENAEYQRVYAEIATRLAAHAGARKAAESGDKLNAAIAAQHVVLGEAALSRGDADEAHRNFQLAMKLGDGGNHALQELSVERGATPDNAPEPDDGRRAKVERALRLDQAQGYFQRGETARLEEDWEGALKCYEGALALDPGWPKYKEAVDNARFELRKREPIILEGPDPMSEREKARLRGGLALVLLICAMAYSAPQLVWEPPIQLADTYADMGPFERLHEARGIRYSGTLEEPFAALPHDQRMTRCAEVATALPGEATLLLSSSDGFAVVCASERLREEVVPTAPAEPQLAPSTLAEAN